MTGNEITVKPSYFSVCARVCFWPLALAWPIQFNFVPDKKEINFAKDTQLRSQLTTNCSGSGTARSGRSVSSTGNKGIELQVIQLKVLSMSPGQRELDGVTDFYLELYSPSHIRVYIVFN